MVNYECYICNYKTDTMVNCMNTVCNRHTTICKKCYTEMQGCCCKSCIKVDTKRDIQRIYHT